MVLVTGFSQLKAQNMFPLKPVDTFSIKKHFNKPYDSLAKLWTLPFKSYGLSEPRVNNLAMLNPSRSPVDHMPIARFSGNSKMPIVRLSGNSRMPVIDPITKERLDLRKPETTVPDSK